MRSCYKTMLLVIFLFAFFTSCNEIDPAAPNLKLDESSGEVLRLASGKTYYIDNLNSQDENLGTSPAAAWKTISKVNTVIFQPGDKILFKAGGSWTKQLRPQGSGASGNPIVIGQYGSGNRPGSMVLEYPVVQYSFTTSNIGKLMIWKLLISMPPSLMHKAFRNGKPITIPSMPMPCFQNK